MRQYQIQAHLDSICKGAGSVWGYANEVYFQNYNEEDGLQQTKTQPCVCLCNLHR